MDDLPSPSTSSTMSKLQTAPIWTHQCLTCKKWKIIPTQEEYEKIRKNVQEVPFTCRMKDNVSCNEPPDLIPGMGNLWGLDKPNLPKSHPGFTRKLSHIHNLSKLEVYYETPTDEILSLPSQVAAFLSEHPEYHHVSPADFDFKHPPKYCKNTSAA